MNKQDLRNKKVLELAEKIDKLRYGEISEIAKTLTSINKKDLHNSTIFYIFASLN